MTRHWMPAFAGMTMAAAAAQAALPADAPFEYKTLPGVSPEPIPDNAGLRGKEDLEAFFDGVMSAHLLAQRVVGATVSVVKDGELYFAKGYGFADAATQKPVNAETTLFRPGSVSKLFTWTAVMQLVEQGKLDLDVDVNQYLTQFKVPEAWGQPITLRNLLTHTPGLEDGGIGYLFARTPEESLPLADWLAVHVPGRVRAPTTDFADASNSSYSNWGTGLAGLIVANVSGLSFDEYVEQNIFAPLGMARSTFREPLPANLAPDMSSGYTLKQGKHKLGEFELIHHCGPAGSLTSTATDMAKFMIAHLQGGRLGDSRILQEDTARYMQARRLSPSPYVNGTGLGFYETWVNGRRWINHAGDTSQFHSNLSLLPEERIGVFVSYNSGPAVPFSQRLDLLKAFTDRYYPARLPVLTPPTGFTERAAEYAGNYRVIRHNYTTNERMFSVVGGISVAPTKDDTLLISSIFSTQPDQWVEVAPDTFRKLEGEDLITFTRDADGAVNGYVWPFPFHAVYKVKWYDSLQWLGFLGGLAVLAMLVALVSVVRQWKADRAAAPAARQARVLAALTAVCYLAFIVLIVVTFSGDFEELFYGFPASFRVALAFPLVAIPLTLGLWYFAVQAWRARLWTAYGRVQYTVLVLAFTGLLWALNHLNLVGYHFG